jgi:hypothetical protein
MSLDFWVRALPRVFLFPSCRASDLCLRGLNFCSFSCQDLQHPVVFSVELVISCSVGLRSCLASAKSIFPGLLSVARARDSQAWSRFGFAARSCSCAEGFSRCPPPDFVPASVLILDLARCSLVFRGCPAASFFCRRFLLFSQP